MARPRTNNRQSIFRQKRKKNYKRITSDLNHGLQHDEQHSNQDCSSYSESVVQVKRCLNAEIPGLAINLFQ